MSVNLKDYGWMKDAPAFDKKKDFEQLPPGGYVCKIFDARLESIPEKGLRLTCDIDIDEGDFRGYFANRYNAIRGWDFNAQFVRYVIRTDNKITPAFTNFIRILEHDNKNFQFDETNFEADQLRALKCGFTFGEKEYLDKLKFLRRIANIRFPKTISNIREGKFEIPPIQRLTPDKKPAPEVTENLGETTPVPEVDDFPF